LVAVALTCGVVFSLPAALGSTPPRVPADRYTPLVQSVMSPPHWFRGTDGRRHLVYELELTNALPVPVTVGAVTVRNLAARRTLSTIRGSALRSAMSLLASPTVPATTVPASSIGVVWMNVVLAPRAPMPRSIAHTLTVKLPPGLPIQRTVTYTGGVARVDRRAPVVLGPPLRGPGWVAVGSCCDGPHRRSIQPVNGRLSLGQRFAIDWNGIDARRRFVVGNPDVNRNWIFYGKPVIAVANATVAAAVDRFPDQIPNHPKPVGIEQADGNHVILALGAGRYAFYAHLKAGSVRVKRGDRVRRGQVVGQLGNSGSSTGPHLHFQVMDRPSALASDGLPYVFARFRLRGRMPPLDASLEAAVNAGKSIPITAARVSRRRDELPLGRDVVNFKTR
jgi:Peptidase family M23